MSTLDRRLRRIAPPERVVVHATDLGGVGVLKHGDLYLLTDPFGDIHRDSRGLGLYRGDTRVLSCSVLRVDGARPTLLRGDVDENFRSTIQLTNAEVRHDPGDKIAADRSLARQSLGFTRARAIGGAFHEHLTVANFTEHPEVVTVDLALGVDAADIFEVRGYTREATGFALALTVGEDRVAFGHVGRDGMLRRTQVAFSPAEVLAAEELPEAARVPGAAVVLRWRLEVEPGGRVERDWTIWADEAPLDPAQPEAPTETPIGTGAPPEVDERGEAEAYEAWRAGMAAIDSDNELFDRLIVRSVADLRLLLNDGPAGRTSATSPPASRGSRRCSGATRSSRRYEAIAFRPDLAVDDAGGPRRPPGGGRRSPDATPSRARSSTSCGPARWPGPASCPFAPYYGSVDSTPLWLILLGETLRLDRRRRARRPALAERPGRPDVDRPLGRPRRRRVRRVPRRAERGLINQGWKDSTDAIRDRDGRTAEPPIALAEVQGYVYDAKRRMARLARHRGGARARRPARARGRPAPGPVRRPRSGSPTGASTRWPSTGPSDPCRRARLERRPGLWGGIVDRPRASAVVGRPDRPDPRTRAGGSAPTPRASPATTRSATTPGSVWPHDNALIVAGLKRYGFDLEASALAGRIFEAAQRFPDLRLPELFCGFDRRDVGVPVPYPVACSPQAWSAAASLFLVRTMFGARANAAERTPRARPAASARPGSAS